MSNTEYGRPHVLRLSTEERAALAVLVMARIEYLTNHQAAHRFRADVRTLRGLLDRLTD